MQTTNTRVKRTSLTDRSIVGVLWLSTGSWAMALVQFIVLVVLARILTPAEFGVIAAAMVVIGFSMIFCQIGVGPALVQRKDLTKTHIHVGSTLAVLLGCVIGTAVAFSAPFIAMFFRIAELEILVWVLAIIFPIKGLSIVADALLQRDMRFKTLALINFVSYLIGYAVIGIVLAIFGLGVWALVFAHIAQVSLHMVLSVAAKWKVIGFAFSWRECVQLYSVGFGFSLGSFASFLANKADYFVVGRWLGADSLGVYGRAYQLILMPAQLIGTVADKVLFPAMATIQTDRERLGRAYLRAVGVVAMLTIPGSALLVALAPEIILVLLGPQWTAVVLPFQLLSAVLVFRTSYKISDSLVRALGVTYRRAWRYWVYAGAVFFGALIGKSWGLGGVAVCVGGAIALNFILLLHLSIGLTGVRWSKVCEIHLRHLVNALVIVAGVFLSKDLLGPMELHPIFILGICLSVGGGIGVLLWAVFPMLFGSEGQWLVSLCRRYMKMAFQRRGLPTNL